MKDMEKYSERNIYKFKRNMRRPHANCRFLSVWHRFTNRQAVGGSQALLPISQFSCFSVLRAIFSLSACMNNSAGGSLPIVAKSEGDLIQTQQNMA